MENGGASILVGNAVEKMREAYRSQINAERHAMRPELWDGKTAERIAKVLVEA
jgi:UDP-N-acetylglucosamine 2-epimerase (non-hydrolysing)